MSHECHEHHGTPALCIAPVNGGIETWRWIPGWQGLYLVSDRCRVLSVDRQVPHGHLGDISVTGRILRQHVSERGYLYVNLWRNGQKHGHRVHRLAAETFIRHLEPGQVVRHLNDVPLDNRLPNLAIGSQKDNYRDAVRNGRIKLSPEAAARILAQPATA